MHRVPLIPIMPLKTVTQKLESMHDAALPSSVQGIQHLHCSLFSNVSKVGHGCCMKCAGLSLM